LQHNQEIKNKTYNTMGYSGAAFFIILLAASAYVGVKLQNIYNERGK
jgi:hypothetical protein